ncbi:MAG: hypothetical protein FJ290_01725 [Planctomycetes bacterium]|nr:hypothetical protein [Planctomycetota bacterium]
MRWLLALALVGGTVGRGAGAELDVLVANGAAADQADAPVNLGVPWPQGALRSAETLRLLDAAGTERPVQAEVWCRWPDGSVKWALLTFLVTVRRQSTATHRLGTGTGKLPAAEPGGTGFRPVTVREEATHIIVSTGAARFRLPRDRFAPFDEVVLEGQERPLVSADERAGGLCLEVAGEAGKSQRFLSGRGSAKAEVESSGPVRAVVRVTGRLGAEDGSTRLDYVARLHFFAGRPAARLQLTLVNRGKEPLRVGDLSVSLPVRLEGLLKWLFAGERGANDTHPGSLRSGIDAATLVQLVGKDKAARIYALSQGDREAPAGGLAGGGASLWGTGGGVAVAVRRFAARGPMALRVRGAPRVEVGILPREAGPCEAFLPGRAITHDLLFWFAPGQPPSPAALSAAFDGPLAARVAGSEERTWYEAAGVLGLAPWDARRPETQFRSDLERLLATLEGEGAWGMWKHGAPLCGRFDPPLVLAREFLRRGEPRRLDAAHAAARHLADVATFHNVAGGDERLTGACSIPDSRFQIPDSNPPSSGESWYAGAWLVALLTGDRAILDAAFKNAEFATRRADDRDIPPLAAALAALNLSYAADLAAAFAPEHAAAFQTALDIYLGKLLDAQGRKGHGLPADRIAEAAIALEALAACQRRRPDPRIPPALLRAAEALASPDAFWSGHERNGIADGLVAEWPRRAEAPAWGIPASAAVPWLAWAAEATGDARFLARARRLDAVASMFPCETPADFALRYRGEKGTFHSSAEKSRMSPFPPGLGLQCHLESAADVALPDAGLGGCALFRPFVALPDGTRACLVQGPGAAEHPLAGLWFPLADGGNVGETQGAIELRLLCRKSPGEQGTTLLVSGDPQTHGFALRIGPKGLELANRFEGRPPARLRADGAVVRPGEWHHLALVWRGASEASLLFDGKEAARSGNFGRLGIGTHLRFPRDPKDAASETLVRDLRLWRRPRETFPAAADATPPAAVTDLLLAPAEGGKMLLSWTAPGDDGTQGQAARYDIRLSSQPLAPKDVADPAAVIPWAEAERVPADLTPSRAGRLEKLLIGPLPARRVYIALRAEDEAGNASTLSNVVQTPGGPAGGQ